MKILSTDLENALQIIADEKKFGLNQSKIKSLMLLGLVSYKYDTWKLTISGTEYLNKHLKEKF